MSRHPEELMRSGLQVIDMAFKYGATVMLPLFSGGHDSYSACFVASKHPKFAGKVLHIVTGIGSIVTRAFVEKVCIEEGWKLVAMKAPNPKDSYEYIVIRMGFPGPSQHTICYHRLKQRCLDKVTKRSYKHRWSLITGARRTESVRRMGNTNPLSIGSRTNSECNDHHMWTSPCYNWTAEEQRAFMDYHGLLLNPVKMSPLAMSGECFCGCFAKPFELEMIREVVPDVGKEIDRLAQLARKVGKPDTWGKHHPKIEVLPTGPMCSSCDQNAAAANVKIVDMEEPG